MYDDDDDYQNDRDEFGLTEADWEEQSEMMREELGLDDSHHY